MSFSDEFYTLNNGFRLPKIGYGTYNAQFQDNKIPIKTAISCGYRYFDTASLYETERCLGDAIKESGIPRDEFIIETKLWIDEMGYDNVRTALEKSLKRLGTDYVDIYMIHWPRQTGSADENWKALDLETWRAIEDLVDEGKVRMPALSNFLPHHLKNILDNCRIRPVADQMELHPGYSQEAAVSYCLANDVRPIAWGPLGRGKQNDPVTVSFLAELAEKYGKSVQQICLRFLTQKGIVVIPKATSESHIRANLEIFDFEMTDDDISMLSCLPQTGWLGEHPDFSIPQKSSNPDNI